MRFVLLVFFVGCKSNHVFDTPLPEFNLLAMDSSTIFNTKQIPTGKPFALVYLDPDCGSCQKETEAILAKMAELKEYSIYFISDEPFARMKVFEKHYSLMRYKNVFVGNDYDGFFVRHFRPPGPPYSIIYNKNKRARDMFSGPVDGQEFVDVLTKLN